MKVSTRVQNAIIFFSIAAVVFLLSSNLSQWLMMAEYTGGLSAKIVIYGPILGLLCGMLCVYERSFLKLPTAELTLMFLPLIWGVGAVLYDGGVASRSLFITGVLWLLLSICLSDQRRAKFSSQLCLLLTAVIASGLLYEQWNAGDFSTTLGRSAFWYMNPNMAAAAFGVLIIASLPAVPRPWVLAFWCFGFIVIIATLSRSGVLAYCCAGLYWLVLNRNEYFIRHRQSLVTWMLGLLILTLGAGYHSYAFHNAQEFQWASKAALQAVPKKPPTVSYVPRAARVYGQGIPANFLDKRTGALSKTDSEAYEKFTGVEKDELLGGERSSDFETNNIARSQGEQESSVFARGELLFKSWEAFKSSPLFGLGYEKAFSLAPHNNFLLMAVAFGLVGVASVCLFLILIFLVSVKAKKVEHKVACLFVVIIFLFMHDFLSSLTLMSILAITVWPCVNYKGHCVEKPILNVD